MAGLLATDEEERLAQLAAARRSGGFMDRAGQAVADGWQYMMDTPDRLRQQTYDYALSKGATPERAQSAAEGVGGRADRWTGVLDAMVPQTAEDVALTAALGPYKLMRKPAAAVYGLLEATGDAEAGIVGAAKKAAKKLTKEERLAPKSDEEALAVLHNTRADRLQKADDLGGLAVPSIAITKPAQGFNSFGDITLVGDRALATPSRTNPIFGADAFTPRFPPLSDDGTKIFRGYTDSGNRRYVPLTLENAVREMKGNIRGGETWNYGAGTARSGVTPQFKSFDDIRAARDAIIPEAEFSPIKDESNRLLFELANKFHPYSKYSGSPMTHADDFTLMLKDMGKQGDRAVTPYYKDLPPELMDEARNYLSYLRDLPTAYFEGKPQRAVSIGEFKGAVVPSDKMDQVAPILSKNGVTRIEQYSGNEEDRIKALMRFRDLMFSGVPIGAMGVGGLLSDPQGGGAQ